MSKSDNGKIDVTIVNSIVLGNCWGITDRRVRQLREEGIISEVSRGKYDLIECTRRYCAYLRELANASNNDGKEVKLNYDTEHALLEKAKREKAELQLRVMKGELHLGTDVEEVMTDMITKAKMKLLALPAKAADLVIGRKDINTIENILQKLIEEALNELADYTPELFEHEQALVSDVSEDDEDE
ncbi:hypothetical protein [Clostridium thermosuccinogenes]|uniref:hypothetical protein n=1 Tax=Clostridium thermosuccinogenes TaxID=84032 RepID=UPI000CCC6031|nr:hypothetical protein [Pseudoclostridium thermosuccinogenes]NLH00787.1 hypothetical protein [Clostridiales bacterium]PNT91278.1 hypothetical protein CDQ83_15865 [Pseudoclostridium thermosuccinogenes]